MLSHLRRSLLCQWRSSSNFPFALGPCTHPPDPQKQAHLSSNARGFKWGSAQLDSISLQVPPIGESTSGRLAFVLKPGVQFGVDEIVAQVKTNKDTIDVLAHVPGAFENVQVQEGETVVAGQVIGVVEARGDWLPPQASAQMAPAGMATKPPCRIPGIQFPPRRSKDGEQLSSRITQRYPAQSGSPPISSIISGGLSRSGHMHGIPPPKLHMDIAEAEMEAVMLGGADP